MLTDYSIKDLYTLALAEGEGMGTAYEYYVKRMALGRMLTRIGASGSILIAGLPEKYGASLDFILLGSELGARVVVIDDRPEALERLESALATLRKTSDSPRIERPAAVVLTDLDRLTAVDDQFDLILSSEILQRLTPAGRVSYVGRLRQMAPALALFCPNAGNPAHNIHSGLAGLRLEELSGLIMGAGPPAGGNAVFDGRLPVTGYIDMPPFPPGITRSAEQREDATSDRFEAFVMWGLGRYAHMERYFPIALRRNRSHIVYALIVG